MTDRPADPENIYSPAQQHRWLVASLLGLGLLVLWGLRGYLSAFLGAGILYVVLRPVWAALVHRRGWSPAAVAAALVGLTAVGLVVPGVWLSTLLVEHLRQVARDPAPVLAALHRLEAHFGTAVINPGQVRALLGQVASHLSAWLPSLVAGLLHFVLVAGLLLVTLYFLFVREAAFLAALRRYLPFRPGVQRELWGALYDNVRANVLGQGLIAAGQGALTGLALWLFQGPDPWLGGALGLLFAFVPALGAPLVWGPVAALKFAQGATAQGAGIAGIGVAMFFGEHGLRLWLGRRLGNIPPLVTLAGVVLGLELFGAVGLVLGPLLLSYGGVLLRVFAQENRRALGGAGAA
ncbi:MAG: AI-2E family transporter [Hymenobacter sp.]